MLVLDRELRVQSINPAFIDLFKVTAKETKGRLLYSLGDGQWDIPDLRTVLEEVLSKHREVIGFEVEHDFRDIGQRHMVLNARGLIRGDGRDALILLAIEDITDRRKTEDAILAGEQLKDLIQTLPGAVYTTDAQGRIMFYNPAAVNSGGARLNSARMNGAAVAHVSARRHALAA